MESRRLQTFVSGLDEILGGGLPWGHVVLVTGLPGTMKSSLTYSILYYNALHNDLKGLYVSLEQARPSLETQMSSMGFDVVRVSKSLHILDMASIQRSMGRGSRTPWLEFLRKAVDNRRKIDGIDMLAIDSLEALEVLARFQDHRRELFQFFEWLRSLSVTSLVLDEAPPEASFPGFSQMQPHLDEGYLADGIIHVRMHQVSDLDVQRRLRVVKMRGTRHETGFFAFVFEDGKFSVTRAMSV